MAARLGRLGLRAAGRRRKHEATGCEMLHQEGEAAARSFVTVVYTAVLIRFVVPHHAFRFACVCVCVCIYALVFAAFDQCLASPSLACARYRCHPRSCLFLSNCDASLHSASFVGNDFAA